MDQLINFSVLINELTTLTQDTVCAPLPARLHLQDHAHRFRRQPHLRPDQVRLVIVPLVAEMSFAVKISYFYEYFTIYTVIYIYYIHVYYILR